MKESLASIDRRCIFRETFESEVNTRRLGGAPTNVAYSNGTGAFNGSSSKEYYTGLNFRNTYSVRIKVSSIIPVNGSFIYDFRAADASGAGYLVFNSANTIAASTGTTYVNGIASTTINSLTRDIIVTGITITTINLMIGCRCSSSGYSAMITELFEIYQGTLTASEVALLYKNGAYKSVKIDEQQERLGIELITNGEFNVDSGWTKGVGWTISNGKLNVNAAAITQVAQAITISSGKKYKVVFTISNYVSGNVRVEFTGKVGTYRTADGTYTEYIYGGTSNIYLYTQLGFVGNIDNISVKEVTNRKLLLDFDSTNGFITDSTGKNTLTPTDISIVRDGSIWAARFNGSTSKIDCGSDIIGVKSITVNAWVKPTASNGETHVLSNGIFIIEIYNISVYVTSNGFTTNAVFSNVLNKYKFNFITVIRKADGKVSVYINGVLAGSTDTASGTAGVGIANIILGHHYSASTRTVDGNISQLQIYEGTLTQEEITQLYLSQKHKYGL